VVDDTIHQLLQLVSTSPVNELVIGESIRFVEGDESRHMVHFFTVYLNDYTEIRIPLELKKFDLLGYLQNPTQTKRKSIRNTRN
jgi:hypothetical protein